MYIINVKLGVLGITLIEISSLFIGKIYLIDALIMMVFLANGKLASQ